MARIKKKSEFEFRIIMINVTGIEIEIKEV